MKGGLVYLFVAYSLIWILIFGYIYTLGRRMNALKKELEELKKLKESDQRKVEG